MYVIDGIFLTRQLTGIQRFAMNMVTELDKLAQPGEFEILVPESCEATISFTNIPIIKYGKKRGYLWEQIDLANYLRKRKADGIFLENSVPFFYRKGIVVLHDISLAVNSKMFTKDLKGLVTVLIWKSIYRGIMNSDMKIVTVSEFSRSEILRLYGINRNRVSVIYNSWEHMNNIDADETVFDNADIKKGNYYFSLATKAPNKNFEWVLAAAKCNPDYTFVIAGKGTGVLGKSGEYPNVVATGYITDGQVKALMSGCKAFLFPSLYEGFGLPPLEALASGAASVILSDIPCLREIYGDIAEYIDPHNYTDIRLMEKTSDREEIETFLNKFSLRKTAERFLDLCRYGR